MVAPRIGALQSGLSNRVGEAGGYAVTNTELESIRQWDAKCGDNEATFFPVTKDRRRLIEHVDELRDVLRLCRQQLNGDCTGGLAERIEHLLDS